MRTATLCLLLKPGKDHQYMSNYRPLSLLNNDYKVFAKILALGLEGVIPRESRPGGISNNTRRLLQVNCSANSLHLPAMAVSLRAEEALD